MSYQKWKLAHPWLAFWAGIKRSFLKALHDIKTAWFEDENEDERIQSR